MRLKLPFARNEYGQEAGANTWHVHLDPFTSFLFTFHHHAKIWATWTIITIHQIAGISICESWLADNAVCQSWSMRLDRLHMDHEHSIHNLDTFDQEALKWKKK